MPDEETMEDFLDSQKDHKPKPEEEEGDVLELVPRLTEAVVLVDWGFTLYGTGDPKQEEKEEETEDDNPAINPELAGLFICLFVCN